MDTSFLTSPPPVSQCDEPGALPYCLLTIGNMTLDSVVNYDCVDNFVFNSTGKKRMSSRCVLDRGEIIPHWTAVDYCEREYYENDTCTYVEDSETWQAY